MSASRWRDLPPDPAMLDAIATAGRDPEKDTDAKRDWGTRFADACAVMFANEMRAHETFRGLEIRPNEDGSGRQSLTGVGGRGQEKVDVIASTLASGLQVALSLDAEDFPGPGGSYGETLADRTYELEDEVAAIRESHPLARVVGIFFLPLDATMDSQNCSTFARLVGMLRARSDRIDVSLPTQPNRLDWSVVGLYVPSNVRGGPRAGVVRYFDVNTAPPKTGRPVTGSTLDLREVVDRIADIYCEAPELAEYAEPEAD